MREQWQLANARQDRSVCLWLEDITRHPSSSRPWEASLVTAQSEQADPRLVRDRQKLTQCLVLQPPLEEGTVLLLEEERRPRFTRFDDAVPQRGQPRL